MTVRWDLQDEGDTIKKEIGRDPRITQSIMLDMTEEGGLEISPWPLDTDCLELRFPGLTIPGERFESAEDMRDALERAEPGVFVSRVTPLS